MLSPFTFYILRFFILHFRIVGHLCPKLIDKEIIHFIGFERHVGEVLFDLLSEDTAATYSELWHDLADADARTWTSILSSVRPSPDVKPNLSDFPFHDLMDFRRNVCMYVCMYKKGRQPRVS